MKFIVSPFVYFSILLLNLALLISAIAVGICYQSIWAAINVFTLFGVFLVPSLPFACQTVKIDTQGIKNVFGLLHFVKFHGIIFLECKSTLIMMLPLHTNLSIFC